MMSRLCGDELNDNERISPTEITRETERRRVRKNQSFFRPEEIASPPYWPSLDAGLKLDDSERILPTEVTRETERRRLRKSPSFIRLEDTALFCQSQHAKKQVTVL
ncbi:hypothetical protein NDU88_005117 [Pleurodeles waltl]|uniref:Uncharacterized protein n=1 Tax=Pleurodeles waltl TaxID=8319 RepID=A0AAV7LLW3_PLEWA|nr:hypothetical protein NDU88_005117 [Pleurodeles waltl]